MASGHILKCIAFIVLILQDRSICEAGLLDSVLTPVQGVITTVESLVTGLTGQISGATGGAGDVAAPLSGITDTVSSLGGSLTSGVSGATNDVAAANPAEAVAEVPAPETARRRRQVKIDQQRNEDEKRIALETNVIGNGFESGLQDFVKYAETHIDEHSPNNHPIALVIFMRYMMPRMQIDGVPAEHLEKK